ncbi:Hypothetical Protein FCC1311_018152 [Hondaea fermentalgiana]|uniref:Uncharacterized protein n=1 Tax=Hondaea fermentalgiana TaxID=2315210 RepID=A0A2R5G3I3_9STRA|nr:Hypothetical Protein FCC1311_018152 [Hondaea fermentalgiana]|eukprot:GBG25596.1 Hypothetical Protein FCC1311_018152 [Hondaea fermentalgiana]
MSGFVTNHLGKILIGNGALDCLALFAPGVAAGFRESLAPLQATLGTSTDAVDECMRSTGHLLFLHGAVRILAGLNVETKLARQLAIISYALEMAFALGPIVSGSPKHDGSKLYPIVFLTSLGILATSSYKSKMD